jgi:hypothetical protein
MQETQDSPGREETMCRRGQGEMTVRLTKCLLPSTVPVRVLVMACNTNRMAYSLA